MSVILSIWEVEVRRIAIFEASPEKKFVRLHLNHSKAGHIITARCEA
jgi:hypothetical protein